MGIIPLFFEKKKGIRCIGRPPTARLTLADIHRYACTKVKEKYIILHLL